LKTSFSQAVANTESEIFRDAMDQAEPDEAEEGDLSREQMGEGLEGQHEAEVAEDESETEDAKRAKRTLRRMARKRLSETTKAVSKRSRK
jgi:hypothetical protein